MSAIEDRLHELGPDLPQPLKLPGGVKLPFPWIRVVGNRALISGRVRPTPMAHPHSRCARWAAT